MTSGSMLARYLITGTCKLWSYLYNL